MTVIKDDPVVLEMFREAMKGKRGPKPEDSFVDNINEIERSDGTSRSYTLSRLKKNNPELFEAVCQGEMSANQAVIQAGYRRAKVQVDRDRRQLKQSQRAMIAAKMATLKRGDNQHTQICATSEKEASELLSVGKRSLQSAKHVLEHGSKDLIEAVEQCESYVKTVNGLSISRAQEVVQSTYVWNALNQNIQRETLAPEKLPQTEYEVRALAHVAKMQTAKIEYRNEKGETYHRKAPVGVANGKAVAKHSSRRDCILHTRFDMIVMYGLSLSNTEARRCDTIHTLLYCSGL